MSESDGDPNTMKGFDPGWNDPPMFSYDSRQVYDNVKKPSLTKRVGLSWDSSSPPPACPRTDDTILPASAPPRGLASGPPPPTGSTLGVRGNIRVLPPPASLLEDSSDNVPLPSPTDPVSQECEAPPLPSAPPLEDEPTSPSATCCQIEPLEQPGTCEISMESVSICLNELAEQLFSDKEREKAEVSKRLTLLDSLWKEDKFPVDLKDKLHQISQALKTGDVDGADRLQRGLMVDHSALCSTWMAAIRKMISEKRQVSDS